MALSILSKLSSLAITSAAAATLSAAYTQHVLSGVQRVNCPPPYSSGSSTGEVYNVTLPSDDNDGDRYYYVSVPSTYQKNVEAPLILSYHGGERTGLQQMALDQLCNPSINNYSFVVYPQGIDNRWQGVPDVETNDTKFTLDIIDDVAASYNINKSSIFATGKSDGGGFVNVLACDPVLSTKIAAFAPVSGAYYLSTGECHDPDTVKIPCNPDPSKTKIPILAFHGGMDNTIHYVGAKDRMGTCIPSIPHFIRQWAQRDSFTYKNTTTPLTQDTVVYQYGQGADLGVVNLVYDAVLGHDWPSTQPNSDNQRSGHKIASFDATPMILDFFAKSRLVI